MNVDEAAERLLEALKQAPEYREYAAARERAMADADNAALLKRYLRAQAAVQMAALAGGEADADAARALEHLSALVYDCDELADYLLCRMRVQRLVARAMERVTREAGLDIELSGL